MKDELENFDKFAHDYRAILDDSLKMSGESGDYFCRYKARFVCGRVGGDFHGKILDYGCGVGLLSECLLKHLPRASIDGYDVSGASIAEVPAALKNQGRFSSNLQDLGRDYDAAVVANVLHHVEAPERQAVVSQIRKMVKTDGKLIIFEHNPINPLTRKIVRESPLDKGVVLLPFAETVGYLKRSGFEETRLEYIVFFPGFLSALRGLEPFLSWLPLGAQYAAIGQSKSYA